MTNKSRKPLYAVYGDGKIELLKCNECNLLAQLDSPEMVELVARTSWNFDKDHDHGLGEWGAVNKERCPQETAEEMAKAQRIIAAIKERISHEQ